MPSRRDSSAKRLFQLFEESRLPRQVAKQAFDERILNPAGTSFDQFFDFDNNMMVHAACSRIALRLNEGNEKDAPLVAAFREAGLDHRNPLHWRHLLSMFAETHFGKIKTKPQKWDPAALFQLRHDYCTLESENPGAKSSELRKLLRTDKRFKDKYKSDSKDKSYNEDAFRKLLRHALSPASNVLLRYPEMKDPLMKLIRNDYEQKGMQWTPEFETVITQLVETFFNSPELKGET
jgi:hypothetical protein